ncbi:type II secretion system protein GspK [Pseudoxanthomonas koreensis]|uniref:type II secretion system protein GspK n=1 Tax=Pseudoxanthomonas koreensis TaxID=266061 RepID=UPI0035A6FDB9
MTIRPPRRTMQRQGGFVLVIVLTLLVVLTLLAGAVAASGSRAVAEAQDEIDRFQGDLDMRSTGDTVLYMLATQRRNIGGLVPVPTPPVTLAMLDGDDEGRHALPLGNEIRLDGSFYAGLGDAQFALQDDRGLLNPNWMSSSIIHAFYASRGAPSASWNELDAKRLDYQDPDSLHRLGGAEREDYLKAGRTPPTNRAVATPLEFRRILGWDGLLEEMDDGQLLRTLTTTRGATINLNTAPVEVLEMIPGMNREHAQRLVAMRRTMPITSFWTLREAFPIAPFMEESLTLFPNISGNLILRDRRFGAKRLAHWRLTPLAVGGPPWQIDYEVILPRDDQSDDAVAEATATPLLAPQDAAGDRIEPPA